MPTTTTAAATTPDWPRAARRLATAIVLALAPFAAASETEFSGAASVNFDSSRHRTPRWEAEGSIALERDDAWRIELGGRAYFDHAGGESHPNREPRAFASLQWTAWKPAGSDLFLDFLLDTDAPSEISGRGVDLSPALKVEYKAARRLWLGLRTGVPLCTAPEEGSRAGYWFADGWASYDTRWLGNESDTLTLSVYGATHETPGYGNTLRLELSYDFDLADSVSLTLGGGSELASPYPHAAMFFAGKIEWKF